MSSLFLPPEPTDAVGHLIRLASTSAARYASSLTAKAFKAVALLHDQGGFSLDEDLEPVFGLHYVVSLEGAEQQIPLEMLTENDILSYRAEYADLLAAGLILGAWVDNGTVYLDLSQDFLDLGQAMKFARENHQLAIWDEEHQFSIPVGPAIPSESLPQAV